MSFKAPRGTVDQLPGEVEKWQYVEDNIRAVCRAFNYGEVRTPIFEHTELFRRGVGETTDIVEKEMYSFRDRGDRDITLRPEGTAGAVRAFVEHKYDKQPLPTKWYYMGPMFRYERPQAGRMRQFHQFGIELLGTKEPAADAEVIALALEVGRALGLTQLRTEINSVGCHVCRPVYREELIAYYTKHKDALCPDCLARLHRNPLRLLDCKKERCRAISKDAPSILDYLCDSCEPHFAAVQAQLKAMDIPFVVNDRMVRGLDYYTETAFEIVGEGLGAQASTIFAGGRYNNLVREIGGDDLPGVGFAVGLERLLLAMEKEGVQIPSAVGIDCYVVAIGKATDDKASALVQTLRQNGFRTERDYMARKMKGQMKAANRLNARTVAILGEDELARGTVQVKQLASGGQEEVPVDNLVHYLQQCLEQEEQ
ncbi:histidine--tRNA ligase [Numidum massiliense]|uniref:histidine--tRNA ligase n=1 Tax=Numidum massiliense TaxID=1522315 RepID=UPI0006D52D80|nr:histidine--tRNA ligase [Numidum massiliense]